jgi:hypothetical protein
MSEQHAVTKGFWGTHDSAGGSSEVPYGTSYYVAEWANTLSNGFLFAAAAAIARDGGPTTHVVVLAVAALASTMRHATGREIARRVDLLCALYAFSVLTHHGETLLYLARVAPDVAGDLISVVFAALVLFFDVVQRHAQFAPPAKNFRPLWHSSAAACAVLLSRATQAMLRERETVAMLRPFLERETFSMWRPLAHALGMNLPPRV